MDNDGQELIVIDKDDNALGHETKEKCHKGNGILHRAFSVFVFNNKGELLLQKRSRLKPLWPGYWSNTCCSHPRRGEDDVIGPAKKRLVEELGFSCGLKFLFKLHYTALFGNKGSENEVTHVLVGRYDGKVTPNPEEVAETSFIGLDELKKDIAKNPDKYTPWFKLALDRMMANHRKEIGLGKV